MSLTTDILGVDPSQRHTGLCLLRGAEPIFHEIKTGKEDVLTSARTVRREFRAFVHEHQCQDAALCIERQLVMGGQSSSLMFHMQMNLMEAVKQLWGHPQQLMMPLPNQLQSYLYHRHKIPTSASDGAIVKFFKEHTGRNKRISIHCVDAYFLAQLGREVLKGDWKYKQPSKEPAQIPWRLIDGQ